MGLRFLERKRIDFPEDTIRVKDTLQKLGFDVCLSEAECVWSEYSESLCAEWIGIEFKNNEWSDERLKETLKTFIRDKYDIIFED